MVFYVKFFVSVIIKMISDVSIEIKFIFSLNSDLKIIQSSNFCRPLKHETLCVMTICPIARQQ